MVSALESQDYEVQEVSIGNNYNLTPPREDKPALETCADEIDEDQIQEASSKLNYSSVQPKEDQDAKLVQGESSTIQGETNVTIQHDDDELIGRQEEKAHLIQLICKGGEKRVISMWGSGGIGKTALAGSIFTSDEVCSHFQISVWVSVSNDFDHIYFFKTLAAELNSESPQVQEKASQLKSSLADMGTEELIEESTSLLRGMRYLIVLDGLLTLEKTHMELILSKLPDDKNGSCVIITTRLVTAAELYASDKENIYELGPLNDHEAHDLLISKVFGNVQIVDVAPELTEETKVIAKKCQGVPLAICVISSVLSTTPRIAEEWRKATDELMSVINEPNPDGMLKILKNSYDQLPYYLKPCFLYLAIFPEDYNIRRGRLVRRWTAEEYAMDYEQYSAEQMSERYFDELISRSMIQPSDGGCRVHDLMLDLAVSLSTKENLMLKLEDTTSGGSSAQRTVQHLVISSGWKRSKPEFDRTVELTRLHSLTVFGEWSPFFISVSTKQLVVLDLEDTSGLTDEHLLHIVGRLRRLRYLSLRGCKGIRQLPNTIGNLNDLQTLDVRGTGVVRMPRATVRLLKLQHLLTSGFDSDKVTPQSKRRRPVARKRNMMSCFPSPAAPASSTDGVRMPEGTGMLHELLTLGVIDATASGAVLKELKELDRLRKLAVAGISAENGKDLADAINDHRRLKSLLVQSMDHDGLQAFVDSMLDSGCSAPKNLQSLKLQGRLVSLPQWIKQLEKLHKLTLTGTRLLQMQESLSFISNLPKLAILHLKEESLMEYRHEGMEIE
uniref:Uncharacterized protein n=1 Tax=Leersia perrieri TaxID=77586 RepID=A0A0D9X657_9ORYZ